MAKRSAKSSATTWRSSTPCPSAYLVADSALYSADNLHKLAETSLKWITRVPATLTEAQEVLAQVQPETMPSLAEGYRYAVVASSYGGVAQRWVLIYSEKRQPQASALSISSGAGRVTTKSRRSRGWAAPPLPAKRMPNRPWHILSTTCRPRFSTIAPSAPRHAMGSGAPRPGGTARPGRLPHRRALASRVAARQARVDQHSCFILATNELDDAQLPAPEVLAGYKGQAYAERGFRFLKDPQFLASSLYLKKPERVMALLMVMTVCLLVCGLRVSHPPRAHGARGHLSGPKGKSIQTPTARWVFHYFVGIHVLYLGARALRAQFDRRAPAPAASWASGMCGFTDRKFTKIRTSVRNVGSNSFFGKTCLLFNVCSRHCGHFARV